jgi:cyclopropane-fatty-acyl-phospholipid synthase
MTTALPGQSHDPLHAIRVTAESIHDVARDLPALVRRAFGYAMSLNYGELTVQLPNGGRYLFSGSNPGPSAEFIIRDFRFARRLFEGGDIGLAEAYIAGEWDTPDLTEFLYLFCVNHEAIATLLPGRPIVKLLQRFRHWLNRNSKSASMRIMTSVMLSTRSGWTGR